MLNLNTLSKTIINHGQIHPSKQYTLIESQKLTLKLTGVT